MREITYSQALMEAFTQEMRRDEKVFHLCGGLGPLAGLIPEFGESRVRVCPISEDGNSSVMESSGAIRSHSPSCSCAALGLLRMGSDPKVRLIDMKQSL